MGGPNRESYLAAQKRAQERRDGLRTRGGVVDLAEWRVALKAARAFRKTYGGAPWFLEARIAPAPDVGFELLVILVTNLPEGYVLPTAVSEVPVRAIVRNPGMRGRQGHPG